MNITPTLYASLWTDDYLDLLNYAKQIGDLSWQEEIITKLTCTTEEALQALIQDEERAVLWIEFDAINDKLLEIFEQMEHAKDDAEQLRLTEKMWDLKLQRVNLHHKIRAINN
ncbi:hypothetical protein [Paenibacillus glacialis]|uniref:Uncharacterized protein n=1 Tax=Paenibacillus glacialis TaxID=494026 RepID=A0A168NTK8_9BACL|nr:hypothetical protein [Paenibacillus glacialis]OAB46099.1 hypothetical protein PGLA_01520 [Paenibacillus glacialis]